MVISIYTNDVAFKGEGNHCNCNLTILICDSSCIFLGHYVTAELCNLPAKCSKQLLVFFFGWFLINLKFGRHLIIFHYFRCLGIATAKIGLITVEGM